MSAKLTPAALAVRRDSFTLTYAFLLAACALQSRSKNPDEALVGERLHAFLAANLSKMKKRVMK